MSIGVHGDKPYEKFFNETQRFADKKLLYNDNNLIGIGTTKTTTYIPGYAGFIPKNSQEYHATNIQDPYSNVGKTNHLLNYKIKIPNYGGIQPKNPMNIKGNPRPYCLSTKDETFN